MSDASGLDLTRPEWLEWRRHGLGGSDIGALARVHPYRTPWAVYWDKVLPDPDHDPPSEAALWGQLQEGIVADEWAKRHGVEALRCHPIEDAEHPWRRGTPDRVVPGGVLEVKVCGEWAWNVSWNGGLDIPPHYQAQGQWYAGLLDVDEVHFAVLVAGRRLECFTLPRDDRAINRLYAIADTFWYDHVVAQQPPDPDGSDDTRRTLDDLYPPPKDPPVPCWLGADAAMWIDDYQRASVEIARWEELKAAAGNALRQVLGHHEATDGYLGDADVPAVTYRPNREVDWAALVEEVGEEHLAPALVSLARRYDTKAVERMLGKSALDEYRHPSDRRTLRVRSD